MKDNTFSLKLKRLSPTFREKQTLVLHQYLLMAIRVFELNVTPTLSIYLLTTYYPQKDLNLLFLQRKKNLLYLVIVVFYVLYICFCIYSLYVKTIMYLIGFHNSLFLELTLNGVICTKFDFI